MSREPARLLSQKGGASAFERSILRAGLDVDPPPDAKEAIWEDLMGQLPPDGSVPDGADPGAAGAGAGGVLAAWWKGMAVGVASALLTFGAWHAIERSGGTASQSKPASTTDVSTPQTLETVKLEVASSTAEPVALPSLPRSVRPEARRRPYAATSARVGGAAETEPTVEAPSKPPTAALPDLQARALATQLKEEARLVREARAALRAHDPLGARSILSRLDREHPRGVLGQEREALAIEALWYGGSKAASRQRAAAFIARFPGSPHASRIRSFADVP